MNDAWLLLNGSCKLWLPQDWIHHYRSYLYHQVNPADFVYVKISPVLTLFSACNAILCRKEWFRQKGILALDASSWIFKLSSVRCGNLEIWEPRPCADCTPAQWHLWIEPALCRSLQTSSCAPALTWASGQMPGSQCLVWYVGYSRVCSDEPTSRSA